MHWLRQMQNVQRQHVTGCASAAAPAAHACARLLLMRAYSCSTLHRPAAAAPAARHRKCCLYCCSHPLGLVLQMRLTIVFREPVCRVFYADLFRLSFVICISEDAFSYLSTLWGPNWDVVNLLADANTTIRTALYCCSMVAACLSNCWAMDSSSSVDSIFGWHEAAPSLGQVAAPIHYSVSAPLSCQGQVQTLCLTDSSSAHLNELLFCFFTPNIFRVPDAFDHILLSLACDASYDCFALPLLLSAV